MKNKPIPARAAMVLAIWIAAVFSAAANEGGNVMRWGLFIGANDGGRDLDELLYADDDALSMATTLTEIGGISSSNAEVLIDPRPDEILEALDGMAQRFNSQEGVSRKEFIFYYSGHSDDKSMILGNRRLDYSEVKQKLNMLDSDVTVAVLDSCSSGAFTRAKGGVHKAPFMMDDSVQTEGHAYLTSSSASEISQESDLIGGSFFTYFLIAGLRGAADENGDGRVTLNEVYQHTYGETISRTLETGGVQHPTYEINLSGSGDLVMTDLNQPSSVLILDKSLEGQLFVKNDEGMLILEMKKNLGQMMPLALPAGEYTVQVVHSTGLSKSAPIVLEENRSLTLTPFDMTPMGTEIARRRGEAVTQEEQEGPEDIIRIQTEEGYILISSEGIRIVSYEDGESIEVEKDLLGEDFLGEGPLEDSEESLFVRNQRMQQERERIPFALTFVPGIGTVDLHDKEVAFELGFLTSAGNVDGIQLGALGALTYDYSNAVQGAGVYTIAKKSLAGIQGSGIYASINGELEGIQTSGVFGLVKGDITGIQHSGVAAISTGKLEGIQVSGVLNVARGSVDGVQLGGVMNRSGALNGVQGAGVLNIAQGDMNGLQASGVLNYAKGDASGMQIGLINIANSLDGIPIGLINLYREGITTMGYWSEIDGGGHTYYSIMTGNDWAYTHFFAGGEGYRFWDDWETASYGFGLGFRMGVLKGIHLDTDINMKSSFIIDGAKDVDWETANEDDAKKFWEDNWGDDITLMGRAVLTTDWGIQPYWGYTAELKKSSLLTDESQAFFPQDNGWDGYGIKYNMVFGIRVDFF